MTIDAAIAGQETLQKCIAEKDAEIERLNELVVYNASCATRLHKDLFNAKAEAIKEFAERLKEKAERYDDEEFYVNDEDIDNLVQEMVGDAE
jgi:cytidylate kinase